jgi:hypothetical protein
MNLKVLRMNNTLLRIVILVMTIFPFVMVGFKLFEEESLLTAGVYTAIVLVLFGTVIAATRGQPGPQLPPPSSAEQHDQRQSR